MASIPSCSGDRLTQADHLDALPAFYHYFDLSNEQAFLHEHGRVSDETWIEWKDGILQNLNRPAFSDAWQEVSRQANESFDELRRIAPPTFQNATGQSLVDRRRTLKAPTNDGRR